MQTMHIHEEKEKEREGERKRGGEKERRERENMSRNLANQVHYQFKYSISPNKHLS